MLLVVQVFVAAEPYTLVRIMGPGLLYYLGEHVPALEPKHAGEILTRISRYLTERSIHHKVTIYETTGDPNLIFLRPQDAFPQDLVSTLVSILATQEITPPMVRTPLYFAGEI
jgi:hypothetical protein